MDMQPFYDTIERAIAEIGIEADLCRARDEEGNVIAGQWNLKKGEQSVWVDVWYIEREERAYFQVLAPMMELPPFVNPQLFREVAEINYDLYGVAMSVYKDRLYIKVIREAEGLDAKEALGMIYRVGNYASHYEPILREKYFNNAGNAPIV